MMRAFDISRAVDCVRSMPDYAGLPVSLVSEMDTSLAALVAFALDRRIKRLAACELLLTLKSSTGFAQDDAFFPPGLLTKTDIADIIAAAVDRRVLLVRPELPSGRIAASSKASQVIEPAFAAAAILGCEPPSVAVGKFEKVQREMHAFLTE